MASYDENVAMKEARRTTMAERLERAESRIAALEQAAEDLERRLTNRTSRIEEIETELGMRGGIEVQP